MRFVYTIFVLIILFSNKLYSEEWLQYISTNTVNCINEDEDYLYIGTNGGILVQDKKNGIQNYYSNFNSTLGLNNIKSIKNDREGAIWILTHSGDLFKKENENFVNFRLDTILEHPWGFYMDFNFDKNNEIWIVDFDNLYHITKDSTIQYSGTYEFNNQTFGISNFNKIIVDSNNVKWMTTYGKGLVRFHNAKWDIFYSINTNISNYLYELALDNDSSIWVINSDEIYKFSEDTCVAYTLDSLFGDTKFRKIVIDEYNNKWIGTGNIGLLKYDNSQWTNYPLDNSKKSEDNIRSLYYGYDQKLFIGKHNGLKVFKNENINNIDLSFSDIPNNFVNSIERDMANNLWFGTYDSGIYKMHNGNFIFFELTSENEEMHNINSMKCDHNNHIWVGSWDGFYQIINNNIFQNFNNSNYSPNGMVYDIELDSTGNILVGTHYGLNAKIDDEWYEYKIEDNPPYSNGLEIMNITVDKNNTFYGSTWKNGIYKFNDFEIDISFKILDGTEVLDIACDTTGALWIGTYEGLIKYSDSAFTYFNPLKSDFPLYEISKILIASNNNILAASEGQGLCILKEGEWKHYTTENSKIPSDYIKDLECDEKGNLWLATSGGIGVLLNPNVDVDENINKENTIKIYPNPATDYIEVILDEHNRGNPMIQNEEIEIFDVLGQSVLRNTPSSLPDATPLLEGNNRINVSHLKPGFYFVRVGDEVLKFVKY